jgi:PAS domain S-box-containing protein
MEKMFTSEENSEKLYKTLFEKNPAGMYIFDRETYEILEVNEAIIQAYGYSREEFLSMTIKDIRPAEDWEKAKFVVKNLHDEYKIGKWRHKKKSGELIIVDIKAVKIEYMGRNAVLAIPDDITDKEKNNKQVEEYANNLDIILSSITDPFFVLDKNYNFIFANPGIAKLTGFEVKDLIGKKLWPVFIDKNVDFTNLRRGLEKSLKDEVTSEVEFTYRDRTFYTHIYPSKIGISVSCSDITSMKIAKSELKLNLKFLKEISDSLPGVIFQTEFDKSMNPQFNYVSEKIEEFTGYTAEEMMQDYSRHLSCIHKDDLQLFLKSRESLLTLKTTSVKYRYINYKTGDIRWVSITLVPSKLSSGHIIRNGILLDVTETEKYYTELEKSNELYSYISKASFAAIWDWDMTTNYIKWGGYYKEMFGEVYPDDICHTSEVKNRPHPDDLPLMQKKYKEFLEGKTNNFWECSYRAIKVDGSIVHLNERGYLIHDEKTGKPVRFVGSTQDVTERVKSQEALLEQSRNVNIIIESISEPFFILNKNLEVLLVNDAALKLSGKRKEEMLGKHIRSIGANADHNTMFDMFEKSLAEQESLQMELNIRGRWFAVYSYPSEIGLAISAKDITSRKEEQEELKERNTFIGEISRTVPGALFQLAYLKDGSTKVNYTSEGIEKLVGLTIDEFKKDPEKRLLPIHPDDVDRVSAERIESLKNLSMLNVKFRFVNQKTNEINWVKLLGYPSKLSDDSYIMNGVIVDINDEQKFYSEMEKSNQRYEYVSKAANETIWDLDLNTGIMTLGGSYKLMYGSSYPEDKCHIDELRKLVHPDDVERISDGIRNVLMEGSKQYWEDYYRVSKDDGSFIHVHDRGYVIYDTNGIPVRMVGTNQDVTALRTAELEREKFIAELEKSNQRYEYISRASNETIWDMDVKTNIVTFGGSYKEMYGTSFPNNQCDGYIVESFIHPDDFKRIDKSMSEAVVNRYNYLEVDYRLLRADGSIIYVYERGYIIFEEGVVMPVRILGTMQDVTALKLSELEREKVIADLMKRNNALEQFTYMVSHNIRAPLANIMGLTEMLEDESSDLNTGKELNKMIKNSSTKLDEVVRDMNDILNIAKDFDEEKTDVNLNKILDEIVNAGERAIKKSKLKITSDFKKVNSMFAVKSALQSVFLNLIENSIKFKSEESPYLNISSSEDKEFIYLTFEDNGIGFDSKRNKNKVFQLYNRFHPEKEGKGMGLFIVKKHVENLDGEITVESEINKGTKFLIKIKKNLHQ